EVGAALVHLARDAPVRDVELEEGVAGRQRHAIDVCRVPGRNDMAARIRPGGDVPDEVLDLVDFPPIGRAPVAPLVAVDRAELALVVGPFVPDGDAVLLQPAHVGVAAQEPEQLVGDRLEVQLLGGEQREAFAQVEAQLPAEERQRAGAGAVGLARAALQHLAQQLQVAALAGHRSAVYCPNAAQSSAAFWNRSSGLLASILSSSAWCTASGSARRGLGSWTCRCISSVTLARS